jgi:hypothetical protein
LSSILHLLALEIVNEQNYLTQKPSTELIVSLVFNNEEHLLRALADTGASSSIILEAYTSVPFIKTDDSNAATLHMLYVERTIAIL